ncbi:hypothetical protein [Bacillus cereus]|uniref:hypothetical protein n=1 Tax=Bacillus cereus TaxID=1396 RepID=UPI0012908968|nr:hypothetical protein [Bacillus cereus]
MRKVLYISTTILLLVLPVFMFINSFFFPQLLPIHLNLSTCAIYTVIIWCISYNNLNNCQQNLQEWGSKEFSIYLSLPFVIICTIPVFQWNIELYLRLFQAFRL